MKWKLPRSVKVTELLCRDGLQHESHFIPTETKVYFVDAFSDCGFDTVEVTNFGHPRGVVQTRDAEDVLKRIQRKPGVTYKCYGMNRRAFERAAQTKQDGNGPDAVAFTISTTDEHCQRNAGRPVAQYLTEIPELVEIARGNGFDIDMAIACVFGCPIAGPVPHAKAFELIDRGLDMGIKKFTPCDTTGEASPERVYEFYTELKERYPKADCHLAHFHNTRGKGLANTLAAIVGGA
ncbi:MAG: hypothetical protein Q8O76_15770 [Chloroflexota bacterium]|nr:hypothetical protein [Chloroflexota bacterium]